MESNDDKAVRLHQRAIIRQALESGMRLTSKEGNFLAHTVDFRKIVSVLRANGMGIKDNWITAPDGRRYKEYYYQSI